MPAPKMRIKVAGVWREVSEASIKVDGTWRDVQEAWTKVGGVWRLVYAESGFPWPWEPFASASLDFDSYSETERNYTFLPSNVANAMRIFVGTQTEESGIIFGRPDGTTESTAVTSGTTDSLDSLSEQWLGAAPAAKFLTGDSGVEPTGALIHAPVSRTQTTICFFRQNNWYRGFGAMSNPNAMDFTEQSSIASAADPNITDDQFHFSGFAQTPNAEVMFASSYALMFRSFDQGATWEYRDTPIGPNGTVGLTGLCWNPKYNRIFAYRGLHTFIYSDDLGETWNEVASPPFSWATIGKVIANPYDGTMIAFRRGTPLNQTGTQNQSATFERLWRSHDGGITWTMGNQWTTANVLFDSAVPLGPKVWALGGRITTNASGTVRGVSDDGASGNLFIIVGASGSNGKFSAMLTAGVSENVAGNQVTGALNLRTSSSPLSTLMIIRDYTIDYS